ncbi:MAG: thiol reductant ABC exporter subunit CydC [Bacillus sp. (in: Bacteria)]|nr:thiol reductant ABC exporter subunit CydC [Bacillus sp. (in: firmicutes)]
MKTWFFPYLNRHRRGFMLAIVLSVLAICCAAGLTFTSGYLISKAALRPPNILMLYVPIVAVRAFGIFRSSLQYASRLTSHNIILKILSEMRIRLYRTLEPAALFIRSRYKTGDVLGILSDDIEHIQDLYLRTILPCVISLFVYGMWIIYLGYFDITFALFMALYLLILIVVIPILSFIWSKRKKQALDKGRHELYQKLTDAVLGVGDWMMSGNKEAFLMKYEEKERSLKQIEKRLHAGRRWRDFFSQLIIGGSVLLLMLWSDKMVFNHHFSATLIAAFVLVMFTIAESLLPISDAIERITQYSKSFQRLKDIELTNKGMIKTISQNEGVHSLSTVDIRCEHVYFKYDENDQWAIENVSLHIPHGKRIALIGRSGAGKSTIIQLLYGSLLPQQGIVRFNDLSPAAFGYNISKQIAILNQNPHLFDTTIANNIRLGNENATDEDIVRVAKQVKLHDYIQSLPKGYQTRMLEAGGNFSGGERQRIALARILLQKTPVVILDEPTVGLDPLTEKDLLATIFESLKDVTLIWITHHLVGIEKVDEVIFLEKGKILLQGSHEELYKNSERYRRLYELDAPLHLKETFFRVTV